MAKAAENKGETKLRMELKSNPVDKLSVKSILGFRLKCKDSAHGPVRGLLLRHASQLYGRPVYESEHGGQYLYWMEEGGNLEKGSREEDMATLKEASGLGLKKLLIPSGYWAIGELGADKNASFCKAYSQDKAVTPDLITTEWYIRQGDTAKYVVDRTVELS